MCSSFVSGMCLLSYVLPTMSRVKISLRLSPVVEKGRDPGIMNGRSNIDPALYLIEVFRTAGR